MDNSNFPCYLRYQKKRKTKFLSVHFFSVVVFDLLFLGRIDPVTHAFRPTLRGI